MDLIWTLAGFIVAVSLLVTIHEFGHYWVARKLGFKVLRFSVGFGTPLWKKLAPAFASISKPRILNAPWKPWPGSAPRWMLFLKK